MSDPDPGGDRYSLPVLDEQDRPVDAKRLQALAEHALTMLHVPAGAELSIALVDPARMAALKSQYLGVHAATDVLSFPMDGPRAAEEAQTIGDVVLCPAVAERQARGLGHHPASEIDHLLVHGILHLAGWTHDEPGDEMAMRAEERRILRAARGAA